MENTFRVLLNGSLKFGAVSGGAVRTVLILWLMKHLKMDSSPPLGQRMALRIKNILLLVLEIIYKVGHTDLQDRVIEGNRSLISFWHNRRSGSCMLWHHFWVLSSNQRTKWRGSVTHLCIPLCIPFLWLEAWRLQRIFLWLQLQERL